MKRFLKWAALVLVVVALGGFLAFLYFIPPFFLTPPEQFTKDFETAAPGVGDIADPATRAIAERGRYIVVSTGCVGCHAGNGDKGPDLAHYLAGGGLKLVDHDGTYVTRNLTPDKETGIGSWTEEMFIKALRTGMHLGAAAGRPILPPMPWADFRNFTDDDLKAIFAFLKSVPAIHNPVPDPKVPPPVIEGLTKTHPKLIEMLDAAHAHHGAPPADAPEKAAPEKK